MKDKIIFKTLMLKGDAGEPTNEQTQSAVDAYMQDHPEAAIDETIINSAVADWLGDHPEATTTVDYSITTKVYNNVAQMAADLTLSAGDKVKTTGYYQTNDNGGSLYIIVSTSSRACSILLDNGLYAELVGSKFNTRQIGIKANTNGQAIINSYIADTSFYSLEVIDPIIVKKTASTTSDVNIIELIQIRRDNFEIIFSNEGQFVLETIGEDYYRILAIRNAENITIRNPNIVGDADSIGISVGEYGHGLYFNGGKNITVYNGTIGKCFGDAVYIENESANISFIGTLYCYYCGRQGMSVADVDGLYIDTIVGENIRRTAPGAVIDFESNTASESIVATVATIRAIDCRIGLTVAGRGDKSVCVDSIITEHSDNNYSCDLEIYGAIVYNENPVVNININRINVSNSKKNCIRILHLNSNISMKIGVVTINGALKSTATSIDEATVFIDQVNGTEIKNISIDKINVINNTSAVATLGVFLYSNPNKKCTFTNCHINYKDDSANNVVSTFLYATLQNTVLKTQVQTNGTYDLNSDIETIEMTTETNLRMAGLAKHLYIINYTAAKFRLYSLYLDGYTINSESYISAVSSGWDVFGSGLFFINFDHSLKTISIKKIA